jgi:hypothetical protein
VSISRRQAQWCIGLATVVAGLLLWPGARKFIAATTPPFRAPETLTEVGAPSAAASEGESVDRVQKRSRHDAAASSGLSAVDEALVAACLEKAAAALQALEHEEIIVAGTIERNGNSTTHILIPQPTGARYAQYSAALSQALDGLAESARRASYPRQVKLLQAYTVFPYPFRLVSRTIKTPQPGVTNPNPRASYVERFVEKRDSFIIDGDESKVVGKYRCRPVPSEEGDRYRHLFQE